MWHDLRFGFRTLAKNPGFTAVAVTALALGIGVNATVFSLVNAILYKNLPFAGSDRVLYLFNADTHNPQNGGALSYPDFRDLQAQVKSFSGLGANTGCLGNFSDSQAFPENYRCAQVTANTFAVLGQKPILGRDFLPEDEIPGAPPVAILSYSLWDKRYGKDASIVGRTVRINAVPTAVIGVMAKSLDFPRETHLWKPYIPDAGAHNRGARDLNVFGRLADGTPLPAAQAELATIAGRLAGQYPDTNKETTFAVRRFNEISVPGQVRTVFLAMLGAVGFVLLIACANVANLLLGRAVARTREMSIRAALGAGRWRVIRQLLAESLILSVAGGVIGFFIAQWGTRAFDAAVIPNGKPTWIDFSLDYRAFAYLGVITLASAVVFGLAPALRLSRLDVNSGLKDGTMGSGSGGRGRYLSSVLVVVEMTLAVVLLAGAGLMIRSFLNAYRTPAGFDTARILTLRLDPSTAKYPKPADQILLYQHVFEKIGVLPGVEHVSVVSSLPGNGSATQRFDLEGAAPVEGGRRASTLTMIVGADYFGTIQIQPQAGRVFSENDGVSGPPVAIVNRGFVQTHLHGRDPIGARLRLYGGATPQHWLTIVGVVPNLTQADFSHLKTEPLVYVPFRQEPRRGMYVLARARVAPGSLGEACRRAVQSVDADLPARDVITLDAQLAQSAWPIRVFGSMFAIFAGIALLLASVGLYAVVAHMVGQRTHEIGVRITLGASRPEILRMVFTQGMRPMFIGLVLGLAAAFSVTRVLSALLTGVSPTDPLTFTLAATVLIASAFAGCAIPARRAMRVDPAVALRHE
jgi:putative ABC transport system permease protein